MAGPFSFQTSWVACAMLRKPMLILCWPKVLYFSFCCANCAVINFPQSYECQLPAPRIMAYSNCVKLASHSSMLIYLYIVSTRPWLLHLLRSKRNHKHPQTCVFVSRKRGILSCFLLPFRWFQYSLLRWGDLSNAAFLPWIRLGQLKITVRMFG